MMNFVDDIDISGAAGLFQGANEDLRSQINKNQ